MSTKPDESPKSRENIPKVEIKPATPNLVSFKSPNRMYYVVVNGEIACLATDKGWAETIAREIDRLIKSLNWKWQPPT